DCPEAADHRDARWAIEIHCGLRSRVSATSFRQSEAVVAWKATRAIALIPTDVDGIPRIVAHFPKLAVVQVHLPLLFEVERASSDAAEDADLVPRLVHGAVAVETLG